MKSSGLVVVQQESLFDMQKKDRPTKKYLNKCYLRLVII